MQIHVVKQTKSTATACSFSAFSYPDMHFKAGLCPSLISGYACNSACGIKWLFFYINPSLDVQCCFKYRQYKLDKHNSQ